jgi:hypothetical protein
MRSMPFPTFHKVREELVLKEIMLNPNTPVTPPLAFYSNNIPTPPTHAQSRPPGNGIQGQGQGRNSSRGDGGSIPSQGNPTSPTPNLLVLLLQPLD